MAGSKALRTTLTVMALLVGAIPAAVSNAAAGAAVTEVTPPAALADADGDGLADDLQNELLGLGLADPVDVIVRGADVATVETLLGASVSPTATFTIIDGFAAALTVTQILTLADTLTGVRVDVDHPVTLTMDGARADVGVDRAAATYGATGAGVGICIIDSGADGLHEQLDGSKIVGWLDLINGLPTPYDDHTGGHGTHVASIAAGDGGLTVLGQSLRGVAPAADLYVVKAFDATGDTTMSTTIQGIEWCANQPGVDILSMSFAVTGPADGSDPLSAAVDAAVLDHDKLAVAGAGNDGVFPGLVAAPAVSPNAIAVGAVAEWSLPVTSVLNRSEGVYLTEFSSRGPTLDGRTKPDIVAPGHTILAAQNGSVLGYQAKSGTSMATPFVAGALALALEQDPTLTQADAAALLGATAIDRGPAGKDNDWGHGVIDVFALVAEASGDAAGTYVATALPGREFVTGEVVGGAPWTYQFTLDADDLDVPIAATILLDGFGDPLWSPDLDARLLDPNGTEIATSTCPLGAECTGNTAKSGRQELLHALPTVAGTYTIEVSGGATAPTASGTFTVDLSAGAPVAVGGTDPNTAPTVVSTADDIEVDEGTQAGAAGTFGDADGDELTVTCSCPPFGTLTAGSNGTWTWSGTPPDGPATYTATVTATDPQGATADDTFTVTVSNVAPEVEPPTVPLDPVPVDTTITAETTFTDAGTADTHTAFFDWGDGSTSAGTIDEADGAGTTTGEHAYSEPGVYQIAVTVTDDDGADATATAASYVAVYDSNASAAGAGWIVPGGSSSNVDDALPGIDGESKAHFGFSVEYENGAATYPSGRLRFRYRVGDLDLRAADFDWLVVTNQNWAKFEGIATINRDSDLYPFRVDARDGKTSGQADRFTIKVWAPGADPDADEPIYRASGDLGGGNVRIRR